MTTRFFEHWHTDAGGRLALAELLSAEIVCRGTGKLLIAMPPE